MRHVVMFRFPWLARACCALVVPLASFPLLAAAAPGEPFGSQDIPEATATLPVHYAAADVVGWASGLLAAVPSLTAGGTLLPDLIVDGPTTANSWRVETLTFSSSACAVRDGDISSPGTHKLLAFHTEVANVGADDLRLGHPSANDPNWVWSACYGVWKFKDYASFALLDTNGVQVGKGRKQSCCVEDEYAYLPTAKPHAKYTCSVQGLSVGWADEYQGPAGGQWVEIDGVPPGTYQLVTTVNPLGALAESNSGNNSITTTVVIP